MSVGWRNDSLRSRVYRAVEAAGPKGLRPRDVLALVQATAHSVYATIYALVASGHLVRERRYRSHHHGKATPFYLVNDKCRQPVMGDGNELSSRLSDLVSDCPGGVSDQVLAAELSVSLSTMYRAARPLIAAGSIVRIEIPTEHGGGMGYRPLGPDAETGVQIDRLPSGCLKLSRPGASVILSQADVANLARSLSAIPDLACANSVQRPPGIDQASQVQG